MNNKIINIGTYTHSANSLFHFMKEEEYLLRALKIKRLCPRYCVEDVSYLNINIDEGNLDRIIVLEKCFCDIPLHDVTKLSKVVLSDSVDKNQYQYYSHTDIYGKYAIAFSKRWGESKGLEPIQYINPNSEKKKIIKQSFEYLYTSSEGYEDVLADNVIDEIIYSKPLFGQMKRKEGVFIKNFHDEREWRFVPASNLLKAYEKNRIIYSSFLSENTIDISNELENDNYKEISLQFEYNEIKYLLVPDAVSRDNLISFISDIELDYKNMMLLASRILVLDDIKEDW